MCHPYCPLSPLLQGEVRPEEAARVAVALHEMGCYEVSMGDTIGVGTAASGEGWGGCGWVGGEAHMPA